MIRIEIKIKMIGGTEQIIPFDESVESIEINGSVVFFQRTHKIR